MGSSLSTTPEEILCPITSMENRSSPNPEEILCSMTSMDSSFYDDNMSDSKVIESSPARPRTHDDFLCSMDSLRDSENASPLRVW